MKSLGERGRIRSIYRHAGRIATVLEAIDNRCIAADGPVLNTLSEATDKELRMVYLAAKGIRKLYGQSILLAGRRSRKALIEGVYLGG